MNRHRLNCCMPSMMQHFSHLTLASVYDHLQRPHYLASIQRPQTTTKNRNTRFRQVLRH
jgi:hypothetical protein